MKLPYLHWETDGRRAKMAQVIREVTLELQETSAIKPIARPDRKAKNSVFEILRDRTAKSKRLKHQMKRFEKPRYFTELKWLFSYCIDKPSGKPSSGNIYLLLPKSLMRWITRQTSVF